MHGKYLIGQLVRTVSRPPLWLVPGLMRMKDLVMSWWKCCLKLKTKVGACPVPPFSLARCPRWARFVLTRGSLHGYHPLLPHQGRMRWNHGVRKHTLEKKSNCSTSCVRKQLFFLWWVPNSVSKCFGPITRAAGSRQFQRYPTTYASFKSGALCHGLWETWINLNPSILTKMYRLWDCVGNVLPALSQGENIC